MGTLITLFLVFIALAVAAWYLGVDSTEPLSSCEWQRRENWDNADRDQVEYC